MTASVSLDGVPVFSLEVVERALENWRATHKERERVASLLAKHDYEAVEGQERLAKRVNRLMAKVQKHGGQAPSLGLEGQVAAREVTNAVFERVLGETRDFLSCEFLPRAEKAARCVARLVTKLVNGRTGLGTGFMVSPRLLLTNHHVLSSRDDAARTVAEFNFEFDAKGKMKGAERFRLQPETFFLNDQTLDFALVAVASRAESGVDLSHFGWSPLFGEEGKVSTGEPTNVIQHPLGEPKRVVLRQNKLRHILPEMLHYEADTEPGSSGSPVFNDQWEVVALHHSGVPKSDEKGNILDKDGGVWRKGDDPERIVWIANEGIRVSRLLDKVRASRVASHEEELREELLRSLEPMEEVRTPMVDQNDVGGGGEVQFAVPLHITVRLGGVSGGVASFTMVGSGGGVGDVEVEAIRPDPNYKTRKGFDSAFLGEGIEVPLPRLTNAIRDKAAGVAASGHGVVVPYHHFSLVMNRERRIAFYTAVNFDPMAPVKHQRDKSGDRWFVDPRVGAKSQSDESLYAANPLDRGHLVRRADAAWGRTSAEAKLANDDTFHFTNCSPQHAIFNQPSEATKRGLLLWGNIEEHIASEGRRGKRRLCVVNGPVFRGTDQPYRGYKLPKEYWKIVVSLTDDNQPEALAFVLSQAGLIKDLPPEDFEAGPYEPFQVKVRDLEAKTKLDFGALRGWDPLEVGEQESVFEAGTEAVRIDALENIVRLIPFR